MKTRKEMKTCSNCKCAFDPPKSPHPFCESCEQAMRKTQVDKREKSPEMGDKGAVGNAVEVNRRRNADIDWIKSASLRIEALVDYEVSAKDVGEIILDEINRVTRILTQET